MLQRFRFDAILPATDLARARRWYAEKLGLDQPRETPEGLYYDCAEGTRFLLYQAGGPASGQHTQGGWVVADIEQVVADLKARGVVFEEYDLPGLKTVNSIADFGGERGAWFKDSEGNTLTLGQLE
jgi:catechol 2,3-dioxygenase-like lactoylglutathione lyase family enzyme